MARLRFIKGTITGRLGEFVGSRWKGINYIKTFSPHSNPRTEAQVSIRLVFRYLSHFASALFSAGLLGLIPSAPRMTERNSVFKANSQMLTNKEFVPSALQVAKANYNPISSITHSPSYSASDGAVEGMATVTWGSPEHRTRSTLHYIVYDRENRIVHSADFAGTAITNSLGVDIPRSLPKANLSVMAFCTALDGDKKLISQTYNFTLA
jgi:hypothetical protein